MNSPHDTPGDAGTSRTIAPGQARAAAHATAELRADFETLVDTSPNGVVVFDGPTGGVRWLNKEAMRIVEGLRMPGETVDQWLGVIAFRRADGRAVDLAESPLADVLASGETVRAEEIAIAVPDGRDATILVNATPVHAPDGTLASVVVTMQDLAPIRELERLRAEFLGMVSHELRAPLTSVKGSAATLLERAADLDPPRRASSPDHLRTGRPHARTDQRPA